MIRSYIYNEIKNAYTFSELLDIKDKIIRAEHFGHLDSKSVDILLMCCEKQLECDIMKKYTLVDYVDIWSDEEGNYSVNDVMKYDDYLEVTDNASDDEIITALVEKGYLRENVEYSIMASDEYFMEIWYNDIPICALVNA